MRDDMFIHEPEYPAGEDMPACDPNLEALRNRFDSSFFATTSGGDIDGHRADLHELEFLRSTAYALNQRLRSQKQAAQAKRQELETVLRDLRDARDLDLRRARILEMIGSHSPLPPTLSAIATLANRYPNITGAAIWTLHDDVLSLEASEKMPDGMAGALAPVCLEANGEMSVQDCAGFEERVRKAAETRGDQPEFVLFRDSQGNVLGVLVAMGIDSGGKVIDMGLLVQLGHLASLAVESGKLHERLTFHAKHDGLTGLPNRVLFCERVEEIIGKAERSGEKAALLWIDLDRFKQINDSFGHNAGDELLCEIARRLCASVHHTDTVARLGGDEFTVVISNATSGAIVERIAARILKAICVPFNLHGEEVSVSASIGMSLYPDHGLESGLLMRYADLAMYHAKRDRSGRQQMFLPEFANLHERRVGIEEQLKSALESGEFHLQYQPIVSPHGEIVGMEALLRWKNPKLGAVTPAEFIPVAEELGFIGRIGEWVLRTACRDGAAWLAAGCELAHIAVNVSALQLADPDFSAMIAQSLEESGFPPAKLEIEVTESVLIRNLERAVDQIVRLRAMGVRFSIDDFGTGYSSLSQLRTLPVDVLKIDRSFIGDIERLDTNAMVRGIIAIAHSMQLQVVAEGVETEAQLSALHSMGCDRNQGFLLCRPMDAGAMMCLLSARGREETSVQSASMQHLMNVA